MESEEYEDIIDDESEIEDDIVDSGDGEMEIERFMNEEDRNRAEAVSVKNQLVFWDMLVNSRIKLQKVLLNCNKLPQGDNFGLFMEAGGDRLQEAQSKAIMEQNKLLDTLFKLSDITSKEGAGSDKKTAKSDLDGDKMKDIDSKLESHHKKLISNVNGVIDTWWRKTNYATRSNKSNVKSLEEEETSIIDNINQILSNRERLLKKTRTQRSQFKILGKCDDGEAEGVSMQPEKAGESYDSEIYDDDDFYGQLLRQLIESKTSLDSVDPISLSRQWLEVQKLRKKMKRKIDTRASKGRRIRYQVHQPLISFMAPIEDCPYDNDARDALFSSIFNQRKFLQSTRNTENFLE